MAKLNLGCGTDIRPGYVNLDSAALPGVDVVHDLNVLPLPFGDGEFDEVNCKDVLEHVDYIPLMRDLHRVMAPGGRLVIESPHFSGRAVWVDPTHRHAFSIDTFDFFVRQGGYGSRSYYFDFHFERIESKRLIFHSYRAQPWNYLIEPVVNSDPRLQVYWEDTALSKLFPASNVRFVLIR
jgi:SAM-dependent methyltransferase